MSTPLKKDVWAIPGPLLCHINLKMKLSPSTKKISAGIFMEIVLTLWIKLGENDILTVLSFPIHKHVSVYIYLHLFKSSNIFIHVL